MEADRIWIWRWSRGDARVFCSADCARAWAVTQSAGVAPAPTTTAWMRSCTCCYACGDSIVAPAGQCMICGVDDPEPGEHELDAWEYSHEAPVVAQLLMERMGTTRLDDDDWEWVLDAAWEVQGEDPREIVARALRYLGYD